MPEAHYGVFTGVTDMFSVKSKRTWSNHNALLKKRDTIFGQNFFTNEGLTRFADASVFPLSLSGRNGADSRPDMTGFNRPSIKESPRMTVAEYFIEGYDPETTLLQLSEVIKDASDVELLSLVKAVYQRYLQVLQYQSVNGRPVHIEKSDGLFGVGLVSRMLISRKGVSKTLTAAIRLVLDMLPGVIMSAGYSSMSSDEFTAWQVNLAEFLIQGLDVDEIFLASFDQWPAIRYRKDSLYDNRVTLLAHVLRKNMALINKFNQANMLGVSLLQVLSAKMLKNRDGSNYLYPAEEELRANVRTFFSVGDSVLQLPEIAGNWVCKDVLGYYVNVFLERRPGEEKALVESLIRMSRVVNRVLLSKQLEDLLQRSPEIFRHFPMNFRRNDRFCEVFLNSAIKKGILNEYCFKNIASVPIIIRLLRHEEDKPNFVFKGKIAQFDALKNYRSTKMLLQHDPRVEAYFKEVSIAYLGAIEDIAVFLAASAETLTTLINRGVISTGRPQLVSVIRTAISYHRFGPSESFIKTSDMHGILTQKIAADRILQLDKSHFKLLSSSRKDSIVEMMNESKFNKSKLANTSEAVVSYLYSHDKKGKLDSRITMILKDKPGFILSLHEPLPKYVDAALCKNPSLVCSLSVSQVALWLDEMRSVDRRVSIIRWEKYQKMFGSIEDAVKTASPNIVASSSVLGELVSLHKGLKECVVGKVCELIQSSTNVESLSDKDFAFFGSPLMAETLIRKVILSKGVGFLPLFVKYKVILSHEDYQLATDMLMAEIQKHPEKQQALHTYCLDDQQKDMTDDALLKVSPTYYPQCCKHYRSQVRYLLKALGDTRVKTFALFSQMIQAAMPACFQDLEALRSLKKIAISGGYLDSLKSAKLRSELVYQVALYVDDDYQVHMLESSEESLGAPASKGLGGC